MEYTRQLLKNGVWQVPEHKRPKGWLVGPPVPRKLTKRQRRKIAKSISIREKRRAKRPPTGYERYIRSPKWRAFRKLVIADRDGKCERCFAGERLEVHHKTYIRFGREDLADVELLCFACHAIEHPRP